MLVLDSVARNFGEKWGLGKIYCDRFGPGRSHVLSRSCLGMLESIGHLVNCEGEGCYEEILCGVRR